MAKFTVLQDTTGSLKSSPSPSPAPTPDNEAEDFKLGSGQVGSPHLTLGHEISFVGLAILAVFVAVIALRALYGQKKKP